MHEGSRFALLIGFPLHSLNCRDSVFGLASEGNKKRMHIYYKELVLRIPEYIVHIGRQRGRDTNQTI